MPSPSFDPAPSSQFLTLLRLRPLGHTASHVLSTLFKFFIMRKCIAATQGCLWTWKKQLYLICNIQGVQPKCPKLVH